MGFFVAVIILVVIDDSGRIKGIADDEEIVSGPSTFDCTVGGGLKMAGLSLTEL